ncbi:MAG: hypothetical protein AB1586_29185 [Pseudomonadota bacterium]|jgi:hypothetical protein
MRDPENIAAIVHILRQVFGDDIARTMLTNGMTLAALIDALVRSSLPNRDAVKLITGALRSGDFIVTPEFGQPSHLKYIYDSPTSLRVVDVVVMTLDRGVIASTDIRLRLMTN